MKVGDGSLIKKSTISWLTSTGFSKISKCDVWGTTARSENLEMHLDAARAIREGDDAGEYRIGAVARHDDGACGDPTRIACFIEEHPHEAGAVDLCTSQGMSTTASVTRPR